MNKERKDYPMTGYDFQQWITAIERAEPEDIRAFLWMDETDGWPKDGIDNRRVP